MKKAITLKEFFRRFDQLDLNGDFGRELVELAAAAILGHRSSCPTDKDHCEDCDGHEARIARGITIRIRSGEVCCVDWPCCRTAESSGPNSDLEAKVDEAIRWRVCQTRDDGISVGLCILTGQIKEVVEEAEARRGETCH